jgi:ribosomal protein L18
MTDWTMQSTEHDLSQMLGDFLRRRTTSAKDLARLIDCDPRTAEGFRAGRHWPSARHFRMIVRTFKRDLIAAVIEPEIDATLARLSREERELEERLEEIRKARRAALGGLPGAEERREPASYRSPLDRDMFDEARP